LVVVEIFETGEAADNRINQDRRNLLAECVVEDLKVGQARICNKACNAFEVVGFIFAIQEEFLILHKEKGG